MGRIERTPLPMDRYIDLTYLPRRARPVMGEGIASIFQNIEQPVPTLRLPFNAEYPNERFVIFTIAHTNRHSGADTSKHLVVELQDNGSTDRQASIRLIDKSTMSMTRLVMKQHNLSTVRKFNYAELKPEELAEFDEGRTLDYTDGENGWWAYEDLFLPGALSPGSNALRFFNEVEGTIEHGIRDLALEELTVDFMCSLERRSPATRIVQEEE